MKKILITLSLLSSLTLPLSLSATEPTLPFTDVAIEDNYYDAIVWLYDMEVIQGNPDGTFEPDKSINRAAALKIILETFVDDLPDDSNLELPFPDVTKEDWFHKYISYSFEEGIVQGFPDGNFYPHETINLPATLKIIFEIKGIGTKEDPEKTWAEDLIDTALHNKWITETESEEMVMTRAKLAEIAYRVANDIDIQLLKQIEQEVTEDFDKLEEELQALETEDSNLPEPEYGIASYYASSLAGNYTASGEIFDPTQHTAAHKTLPFNTIVKVTNESNGQSTIVRINDRGPFTKGFIIDLAPTAFEEIANLSTGIVNAKVEVIELPE